MADTNNQETLSKEYLSTLDESDKMLIILRDELYSGDWDLMLKDLNARRSGKPFIYKLADKIDKDVQGIEKIQVFEKENSINLGNYINLESEGFNK